MEPIIRERAAKILDELPIGETFDWVDRVSIELTTQMLATLFDFPFEERRKLTYWSDVATAAPMPGAIVETEEEQQADPDGVPRPISPASGTSGSTRRRRGDLISMLAHGEATRNMTADGVSSATSSC